MENPFEAPHHAEAPEPNKGPSIHPLAGWIIAAVGSALLVMLLNRSGETQRVDSLTAAVVKIQQDIDFIKTNYTLVKQTDDLRDDVRELTRTVNSKLETVIAQQNTLMLEFSRKKD